MKLPESLKGLDKEWKNILFDIMFIVLATIAILMSRHNLPVYLTMLGVLSILGLLKWKSVIVLLIYIAFALLSPISEISSVYLGVWTYENAKSVLIPLWLTFSWGSVGAFIYQTFLEVKRLTIEDDNKRKIDLLS